MVSDGKSAEPTMLIVASPDDERIGRLLVALRRRTGTTQRSLGRRVGVPRDDIGRIEAGHVGEVRLDRVTQAFDGVGARARLTVWWNGASADRLLDDRHAAIVESVQRAFEAHRWGAEPEVSFSVFGERGSIDVLAALRPMSAVAVCEVKTELGSLEETNRVLDAKVRLAPRLAQDRWGWQPTVVGRLLILAESSTNRRIARRHERTMAALYPARTSEVKRWVRRPSQSMGGLWFLSEAGIDDHVSS